MPKIMEPSRFVRVENVKKREGGHEYRDPSTGVRNPHFNPGWYYFSYRPVKFGPFANEEAAQQAGNEAAIRKRAI